MRFSSFSTILSPLWNTGRQSLTSAISVIVVLAACTGCHQNLVVEAPNPVEIDRIEYTRIYNAAVEVLREYDFQVDRHSHRFGTITTRYLASPTIFEPWRKSNTTSDQAWENTFNQQQRRVIVTLEPTDVGDDRRMTRRAPNLEPAAYRLRVEVFVERREHPNRYLAGATAGHGVFGTLTAEPGELSQRGVRGPYWRPLGRDPLLEQRLLADMIRRSLAMEPTQ